MHNLSLLPEEPIGDVHAYDDDVSALSFGEGDVVEYVDTDEQGAPRKKKISAKSLANRLATGTASPSQRAAAARLKATNPSVSQKLSAKAVTRALSRNDAIVYEHATGAKLISSTLGHGARLRPSEVEAVQAGIYLSTPFQPSVFQFSAGPPAVLDVVQSLNTVIGTSNIRYAGIYIVLAASNLNINQGAVITITRNLGTVNAVQQSVINTWQLEAGMRSVDIMLLNAVLISGKPRLYMPQVAGNAVADATTNISISGLPANYTATARFIQPGDGTVDSFLSLL